MIRKYLLTEIRIIIFCNYLINDFFYNDIVKSKGFQYKILFRIFLNEYCCLTLWIVANIIEIYHSSMNANKLKNITI